MISRAVIVGIIPAALFAQTSAYQSTDSNSSILLFNQSANAVFNVTDSKFTVGYLYEPLGPGPLFGLSVFGKPSSSVSDQIFNTKPQGSVGGTLSVGRHVWLANKLHFTDDWWAAQFTYTHSATEFVTDANTQPQKRTFDGAKGLLTYNFYRPVKKTTLLAGLSLGVSKNNNVDDLKPVTIDTLVLQSATGISPSFEAAKSTSGYSGAYRTYTGVPIYSDVVIIPHPSAIKWLSLDLFTRSNAAHFNRFVEGGVGLFIAEPDKPTKVLGGITLAWKNGAPTLGVVAGWGF
jgi:hypothetical protein